MKNEKELHVLLHSLSLEEKIGQLVQLNEKVFSDNDEIMTGPLKQLHIKKDDVYKTGSTINVLGAKKVIEIQRRYLEKSTHKIPMMFMADVINGYRTVFPIPLAQGATFDPELIRQMASVSAKEASVAGIHVTFSPVADLTRDARWGRVMESNGEDPYLTGQMAAATVKGYGVDLSKDYTIASCLKHFAGYGAPIAGREYNTVELSMRTFMDMYMPAYKEAIDAGCHMVMSSFNTIDGIPSTGNKWLMDDILRKKWKFNGVTIADFAAVKELMTHGVAKDEKEAAQLAINAKIDIDMLTSCYSLQLKELIEDNEISLQQIDEAVLRVLKLKNDLGLFDNPYRFANVDEEKRVHLCQEHLNLARKVVHESCVLLKNKHGILPLNKNQKIALIGPYAQSQELMGSWSFCSKEEDVVSLEQGFHQYTEQLQTAKGCVTLDDQNIIEGFGRFYENKEEDVDPDKLIKEALQKAKNADVIVLALGEHNMQTGEGGSRGDITLPDVQVNLLKTMKTLEKPIVILLFNGRPLALTNILDDCDALLECWFPGTQGGNGIADLVFGTVNPSGKLPMSFPYDVGQCPISYNEFSTGRPLQQSQHSLRFTSRYTDIPNYPLFEFGYGLSYSKFEYKNLMIDGNVLTKDNVLKISIDIENISDVSGDEIVQLYTRDIHGSVVRPIKELKGFQRIHLESHEKKKVMFEIKEEMLRFYNIENIYTSEDGDFEAFIGASSSSSDKIKFKLKKEG